MKKYPTISRAVQSIIPHFLDKNLINKKLYTKTKPHYHIFNTLYRNKKLISPEISDDCAFI
jgi:hypothetical protein